MLPTDPHVLWAYFLAIIERVYKSWDLHSLLVAGYPLTTQYKWNLFKSAIFQEWCSTLKIQRIFHYRPKYVLFSPFFSNRRALWIKLNKFTIKNLRCNDVTTVCICYVLHLYFLSYHYSAWTKANCLAFFLQNLPKIMDKKKEHCYHSYFCFLWTLFVTNCVTKHLCLLNLNIKFLQQTGKQ